MDFNLDNDDIEEDEKKKDEPKEKQNAADEIQEDLDKQEETHRDRKSSPTKTPKTPAASTFEEKQRQLLLADCQRLKKKMTTVRSSIQRPPL
jgi:hypothetical protein